MGNCTNDTFRCVISIACAAGYGHELYRCVDLEPELQNDDLFNLGVIKSKVLEKSKDKKLLNGKVLPMTRLTSACADAVELSFFFQEEQRLVHQKGIAR
jgi:hypothetical protein